MTNKAKIDQFYQDVDLLGLKFPVAEISKRTGQSKGNVSRYLAKKLEPSDQFMELFYQEFSESFKKVARGTRDSTTSQSEKPSAGPTTIELAMASLAKSLEDTAAAARIKAEADKVDADSRKELIDMLKANHASTVNASAQTFEAVRAKLGAIQEFVKELSLKAGLYKSDEEVIAVLNRKTAAFLKEG